MLLVKAPCEVSQFPGGDGNFLLSICQVNMFITVVRSFRSTGKVLEKTFLKRRVWQIM